MMSLEERSFDNVLKHFRYNRKVRKQVKMCLKHKKYYLLPNLVFKREEWFYDYTFYHMSIRSQIEQFQRENKSIALELKIVGNGRVFLNFWNSLTGDDVIAELIDGKLMLDCDEYDEETEEIKEMPPKEVTFHEFAQIVVKKLQASKERLGFN